MDEYRIIETILAERDITDVDRFLNPQIEDMLPLDDLKNIDEAFLIVNKILSVPFTKIMVLFDTDTDGICSGTIITRYLHDLYGRVVETVIDSGKLHGLQDGDLWKYRDADLLIIVDSLDSSEQNYRNLREDYGVENIIVLDHHAIDPTVPYNDWITLAIGLHWFLRRQITRTHPYPARALHGNFANIVMRDAIQTTQINI